MTKHEDLLKQSLLVEDPKLEILPKIVDNQIVTASSNVICKPKNKIKIRVVKNKMPVKRTSRLERATCTLHDLEEAHEPEKCLDVDFGLYQMEDY